MSWTPKHKHRFEQVAWAGLNSVLLCWLSLPIGGSPVGAVPPKPPSLGQPSNVPPPNGPVMLPSSAQPWLQGRQILLNGRTFNAAWGQWQTPTENRIALSEAALMQLVGLRLLSTENFTQQPIDWFTNPQQPPEPLTVRLAPPTRYLDITALANRLGWQVQAKGDVLDLRTPNASLVNLRQGKQPWGDRVVVDLDRPTPYQVDAQSQELLITLDAKTDAALIQRFKPTTTGAIKSLKVETAGDRTTLRLGVPITQRPSLFTLSNPNRLVIDIGAFPLQPLDIAWGKGLRWRQQALMLGTTRFPVVALEIDPKQTGVQLLPVLPNFPTIAGTASLLQTAQQSQASGAINGGFFNRLNQLPLGAIRLNGQWRSGPILNRGVVAWTEQGQFRFDRYNLKETAILANGQRFPLTYFNSAYVQAGIARYNAEWGSTYTTLSDNEILVTVQNNQVTEQKTAGKAGETVSIPTGTAYLLVFRSNRTAANQFTPGTTVQLDRVESIPGLEAYPHIVGGGPLLVKNRQVVLDAAAEQFSLAFAQERAARSAIGQLPDGKILLVSVHNREGGSGPSLGEMASIMQQLGAVDALNLDGGSSTTLYLGGQIVDRPPRSSARVHEAIGVFLQP